jgi:hypothetical protein
MEKFKKENHINFEKRILKNRYKLIFFIFNQNYVN